MTKCQTGAITTATPFKRDHYPAFSDKRAAFTFTSPAAFLAFRYTPSLRDRQMRDRAYWRRAIQRKETRNPSKKVPQIIPVATTIAVGKLINGPLFQLPPPYGSLIFQVSPKTGARAKRAHYPAFHTCGQACGEAAFERVLRGSISLIPLSNSGFPRAPAM